MAHFVTVKPSADQVDGYAQFTMGRYEQVKFECAIGGPLTDTVSVRLSMATHNNDGYVRNRLPDQRLNNANDWVGRPQLLWEPTDTASMLLSARLSGQDMDTGFFEHVTANTHGVATPDEVNAVLGYIDNDGDPYAGITTGLASTIRRQSATPRHLQMGFRTLHAHLDYGLFHRQAGLHRRFGCLAAAFFHFFLTTDTRQFSQELRLNGATGNTDCVADFYYLDLSVDDSNGAETEPFITDEFSIRAALNEDQVPVTESVSDDFNQIVMRASGDTGNSE